MNPELLANIESVKFQKVLSKYGEMTPKKSMFEKPLPLTWQKPKTTDGVHDAHHSVTHHPYFSSLSICQFHSQSLMRMRMIKKLLLEREWQALHKVQKALDLHFGT